MNQLSWLLYWADIAQSSEGWLNFFGWVASIIGVIALIAFVIISCSYGEFDSDGDRLPADKIASNKVEQKEGQKVTCRLMGIFLPVAFITIMMSIFIPSKDTFYAIAASELGEHVASSEIGQKAGQAIEAWLDRQINETRAATADAVQPAASTPAN